jgi:hypothetical protein
VNSGLNLQKVNYVFALAITAGLLLTSCIFSFTLFDGIIYAKTIAFIFLSGLAIISLSIGYLPAKKVHLNFHDFAVILIFIQLIINDCVNGRNLFSLHVCIYRNELCFDLSRSQYSSGHVSNGLLSNK